jgi:hypothetical protein
MGFVIASEIDPITSDGRHYKRHGNFLVLGTTSEGNLEHLGPV